MINALMFLYAKNEDGLQLFWQLWYLTMKISIMFSKKAKMIIIYLSSEIHERPWNLSKRFLDHKNFDNLFGTTKLSHSL